MTSKPALAAEAEAGIAGRSTSSTSAPMSASIIPANGAGPDRLELEDAQSVRGPMRTIISAP